MSEQTGPSAEQAEALDIAREMIAAGIPIFAAPPCPAAGGGECGRAGHASGKQEYDLPSKWQQTVPSEVWLERWQPGWALGAVGGHVADFLDEDPRNGGSASVDELKASGQWPRVFGIQQTPSGGFHYVISPLGERETNGFMPGMDYQGGAPDGQGRAFVWIAPTVKKSKAAENAGQRGTYRWLERPDLEYLAEFGPGADDSVEGVRTRLAARATKASTAPDNRSARIFTEEQARQFCDLALARLENAKIGQIEEAANAAACQLSHFVPDFWSEDFAFTVLELKLAATDYDPDHAAATWTADKFRDVIAGRNDRAPKDWKAVRAAPAEELPEPASVPGDEVDALLAEMLTPEQMEIMPAPRHLIRGLLTLDSESWLVGGPGSKKSFVALDMAARVSTGQPWQELETTQGAVVFIVAEGAGGSGKRVKAWQKEYGRMGAVHFLPRPVQAKNAGAWAVLVEACRRLQPVLVVLDTQARVTVGLEENSATEMGIYVERVRAIREATGACVLTIHHTGRRGADARGSSALDGAQSSELTVEVAPKSLAGKLKVTKQKDIDEADDIPLHFKIVDLGLDEFGAPVNSLVPVPPDVWRRLDADADPARGAWEDWARNWSGVAEQALTVLVNQGGEIGLTKSEARRNVAELFYGGQVHRGGKDRPVGALVSSTFDTAWTKVLEARSPAGDPVVVNVRGEKYAVDQVARDAWKNEHGE